MVCADGQFRQEILRDLTSAGLDVRVVEPSHGDPDLTGAVGFVAGTSDDPSNLALLDHAQRTRPEAFTVLRQDRITQMPLVQVLHPDSLFVPSALVARQTLARVVTPVFWTFIEHALEDGSTVCSFYGHLNAPAVATGATVKRGDPIATILDWNAAFGGRNSHLHYVILSEEQIKAAYPKSTQTIEIESFVKASEIPFTLLETPYYLEPIGKGGFATVYLARPIDGVRSKRVAIKVLHKSRLAIEPVATFLVQQRHRLYLRPLCRV